MRVTRNAVRNNWQYNFAMAAGLCIWFVFACIILADPKGAMDFVARSGKFRGIQSPWVLAALSSVPAFLLALPFGAIGRIFGIRTASRLLSERAQEPAVGDFSSALFSAGAASGGRGLQSERWMAPATTAPPSPSYQAIPTRGEAPPSSRGMGSFFLRILFGVLWIVVFFVVGSISISAVVMVVQNGDQEARQKAVEAAGRAGGVPLFFGSILLVVVLAILGWLPGFRRRKGASPTSDSAFPRSKPSDSRPILAR
jgi:hypothetical protein